MESGDDLAVSHEVFIDIKKPSDMKLIRTAEEALEKFNYHVRMFNTSCQGTFSAFMSC